MVKGREKSDDRIVPEGRRKAIQTVGRRGGKAVTASKQVGQLELFSETADSPKGNVAGADVGQPTPAPSAVPKSESATRGVSPVMRMEEVANDGTLKRAFEAVASNRGAPGPDRQSISDVRKYFVEILPILQRELLEGSYRPGMIRRVWIPKSCGEQRGLGIPDVIDRIVQQVSMGVATVSDHGEAVTRPSLKRWDIWRKDTSGWWTSIWRNSSIE